MTLLLALVPTLSLAAAGGSWLPVGAEVGTDTVVDTYVDTYVVLAGDTLYSIARRHGTDVATLAAWNGLADPSHIRAGQVLVLAATQADPQGVDEQQSAARQYTVMAGDTLYGMARRFGVTVQALLAANSLANPNLIQIGQVLTVPAIGPGVPGPAPVTIPASTARRLTPTDAVMAVVPDQHAVATPVPLGPVGSGTVLPTSLFGRAATDPARLALMPSFDRWATHHRIDRNLLEGLAYVESSWRVDAVSSAGAVGIGQLMPATSAWIATHLIGDQMLDPHRADDNIRMSARYLRYLIDQLGVEDQAIGAYYQGIGSVQRDGMGAGTVQYIARVRAAQAAFVAG